MSWLRRSLFLGLTASLCLATPQLAQAAPGGVTAASKGKGKGKGKRPMAAKTAVRVWVVHASNNGRVDPDLKPVMQQLRFTKFTGFRLLDRYPVQLGVGGDTTVQIAGGRRLKIQLLSRNDREAKLRLRMFNSKGKLLDTTVSIHRNRSFLVAGPRYKDGKLVIAVKVRY